MGGKISGRPKFHVGRGERRATMAPEANSRKKKGLGNPAIGSTPRNLTLPWLRGDLVPEELWL